VMELGHWLTIAILLFTAVTSPACTGTLLRRSHVDEDAAERRDRRIAEGRALAERGQFAEAVEAFEDATYADPESAEAFYLLARARLELGRTYPALDALRTAERLRPDDPSQRILLGQVYVRLNRLEEAEPILEQAVESWPEEPRAHYALGVLRVHQGRLGEAEVSLTQAVRMAPRLPGAQEMRGRVLLRLGRTDQAITAFEAAVEQRDCDDLAHGGLAAALVTALQPARGQAEFQRAADCADGEHAVAWRVGLAMAYAAEGRYADALGELEGVRGNLLRPRVSVALQARLQFLRLGWEAAGCTAHETICRQADQRFWSGAMLLLVMGAADAAERELRGALDLYDGDAMTRWLLAEALAELNRRDEALLELERAEAWSPAEEVTAAMEGLRQDLEAQ